jgi:uncharacterized protein (DUF302 family)
MNTMNYYITRKLHAGFEEAIESINNKLKDVGFGVLTRIDIHDKLKEKLDVDFRRYTILGACNPAFAHQALLKEDKLGVMLPCNVIVQELSDGEVEVSAIDPVVAMEVTQNRELLQMAKEVHQRMEQVINSIG